MKHSNHETQNQNDAAASASQRRVGDSDSGASPSNTAPTSCIQILRKGIDSFYLSYSGELSLDSEAKLSALKEMAQSMNPMEQARASLPMGEHLFEVRDKGTGYYPYVLVDNAYRIQLSASKAKQLPLAYLQVKSDYLTAKGIGDCKLELQSIISSLGIVKDEESISRVDLFVDFITDIPIHELTTEQFVTRARRKDRHYVGSKFTGFSFGLGGDIVAVLYNKTEELKESKKFYLYDLWKEAGWDGISDVWRLELRFKSKVLREHQTKTIDQLLVKQGPIWRYGTSNWLRLTIPNESDTTQSRWPTHPLWQEFTELDWLGSYEGISIPHRVDRAPNEDYLFSAGLSSITAYMAVNNITNVYDAIERYYVDAEAYHNEKGHFTGASFEIYMQEKAANKAKKYNLEYDLTTQARNDTLKEISAELYRKGKDGE